MGWVGWEWEWEREWGVGSVAAADLPAVGEGLQGREMRALGGVVPELKEGHGMAPLAATRTALMAALTHAASGSMP